MTTPRIREILAMETCPQNCDLTPLNLRQDQTLVSCRDLHFAYHDGKPVVQGVGFEIQPGEAVALCGPNGSGKSTLLKLLTGLLFPDEGSVDLHGVALDSKTALQVHHTIGFLFQDSHDQLFNNFVSEDVAYGPSRLGVSGQELKDRVSMALHLCEAQHLAHRPIHHLSGGEMKRVALAGLIAMRPPLLILDEPTNGLDPAAAEHLEDLLRHLHHDHGYALLVVTHDMERVPRLADRVLVMDHGTLQADGEARKILSDIPLLERSRLRPPQIAKFHYERWGPSDTLPLTLEEALEADKARRDA